MPQPSIHTYHCLCSELLFATYAPLASLPKRKIDKSYICKVTVSDLPIPSGVVLSGSSIDDTTAVVLKLEDGFEKRYATRCRRCDLQFGYWLDKSQFDEAEKGRRTDVLYLLAGGLVGTDEMRAGRDGEG